MRIRTTRDVAAAVRGRRKDLEMTQLELAERAGVSRRWVYQFEAGKTRAELGLVLTILEQLGLDLEIQRTTRTGAAKGTIDLDAVLKAHRKR